MIEILKKFFRFCGVKERREFTGSIFLGVAAALFSALKIPAIGVLLQSILNGAVTGRAIGLSFAILLVSVGGSSLLNMNKTETVFTKVRALLSETPLRGSAKLLVSALAVLLVCVVLGLFLRTRLGLAIRATGNNPAMVRSSSVNTTFTTIVGLCVANAFTALSGCLLAQSQKSVNIDIGTGMVTIALASLLIGKAFFGKRRIPLRIFGMVFGAFLFRLVYTVALRFDMPAFMLKLVSSVIVVIAISGPYFKKRLPLLKQRLQQRRGGNTAC